jgi:hypothetical protein
MTPIAIPDDLLAHLQLVVASKLSANESFTLTWVHGDGRGRSTLWLERSIPMRFDFATPGPLTIDPSRMRSMLAQAGAIGGLSLGTLPVDL